MGQTDEVEYNFTNRAAKIIASAAGVQADWSEFDHALLDLAREADEAIAALSAQPALENGPAGLADAHTNPPLSGLSSLRKGAEVGQVVIDRDLVERAQHQLSASPFPFDRCVAAELSAALVSGSREDGTDG